MWPGAAEDRAGQRCPAPRRVGAVVVTFRRPRELERTLGAVAAQSSPVWLTVVVDNDAGAGETRVRELVAGFPRTTYLGSPENLGYGAALSLGMQYLRDGGDPEYYWLLDDDSPPACDAVSTSLSVCEENSGSVGVVADRGGHIRTGRIVHDLKRVAEGSVADADFTLVDGALISRSAVSMVGLPRSDFFMMLEDFEYTTRIRGAGFRLLVRARDETAHLHLGSGSPWRGYYQARNLLRIAAERRSAALLWGWLLREVAICGALARNRQYASIRLRLRGWKDGILGRMGRTVPPP